MKLLCIETSRLLNMTGTGTARVENTIRIPVPSEVYFQCKINLCIIQIICMGNIISDFYAAIILPAVGRCPSGQQQPLEFQ